MMTIETTQSEFHPMLGHVADGTTIIADNGDVLTIRPTMAGWKVNGPLGPSDELPTAAHVERYIVRYGYD